MITADTVDLLYFGAIQCIGYLPDNYCSHRDHIGHSDQYKRYMLLLDILFSCLILRGLKRKVDLGPHKRKEIPNTELDPSHKARLYR